MTIRVIEPPATVVSLDDAKKHLRVVGDTDNLYIEGLIEAATAWLDGPVGWLGRSLGTQTLELLASGFDAGCDGLVALSCGPLIDIISIKYIDTAGVEITLDPEKYVLDIAGVRPVHGERWPAVRTQSDAVRIQYRSGYGVPPGYAEDKIPRPIWAAILMLVGHWYENREVVVIGVTASELPFAVEALLSQFRVYV